MMAKREYERKQLNTATKSLNKEMVVRYMTVLTLIFVIMDDILSLCNFLDKDGPRIKA